MSENFKVECVDSECRVIGVKDYVDIDGLAVGDPVYLSETAGAFTTTAPECAYHPIPSKTQSFDFVPVMFFVVIILSILHLLNEFGLLSKNF